MNRRITTAVVTVGVALSLAAIITLAVIDTSASSDDSRNQCSLGNERHKVIIRRGSAPYQLTTVLGILRRPGTERDKLPDNALAHIRLAVAWIDNARIVASSNMMWRAFLVPGVIASGCVTHNEPEKLAISVATFEGRSLVGANTYRINDIIEGRAVQVRPAGMNANLINGIVADGITTVAITVDKGPVTAVGVEGNAFAAKIGFSRHTRSARYEVKWDLVNEQGDIVRSITRVIQRGGFSGSFAG